MIVSTTRYDLVTFSNESLAHSLRISLDLLLIFYELWLHSLIESHSLRCYHVLERATLNSREHTRINHSRHLLNFALRSSNAPRIVEILTDKNHAATRTTQCLVSSRCDNMSIFDRILQKTGSNQTSSMSHIDHKQSPDLIGNLAHPLIIPFPGISRSATNDKFRMTFLGDFLHRIIIDVASLFIEPIRDSV